MKNNDFVADIPMPDEYLIELGKITVLYGALEFSVDRAISKLSGYESMLDWRVSIMTAHLSFQQRLNTLGALFEQVIETYPNLAGYEKIVDKIKSVQKKRNKFIHSMYTCGNNSSVGIWSITARGSFKIKSQDVYIQEIRETSLDMNTVRLQLEELISTSASYEEST